MQAPMENGRPAPRLYGEPHTLTTIPSIANVAFLTSARTFQRMDNTSCLPVTGSAEQDRGVAPIAGELTCSSWPYLCWRRRFPRCLVPAALRQVGRAR